MPSVCTIVHFNPFPNDGKEDKNNMFQKQNSQLPSSEHSKCGGTFIIKEVTYIFAKLCQHYVKKQHITKGPVRSGK